MFLWPQNLLDLLIIPTKKPAPEVVIGRSTPMLSGSGRNLRRKKSVVDEFFNNQAAVKENIKIKKGPSYSFIGQFAVTVLLVTMSVLIGAHYVENRMNAQLEALNQSLKEQKETYEKAQGLASEEKIKMDLRLKDYEKKIKEQDQHFQQYSLELEEKMRLFTMFKPQNSKEIQALVKISEPPVLATDKPVQVSGKEPVLKP